MSEAAATRSATRQFIALIRVMRRFFRHVHPQVRRELGAWEARASAIPDAELRANALETLSSERLSATGAALFAATVGRHEPALVRALVAFQVAWDYLDTLSEQPSAVPIENGTALHRALVDALDPGADLDDYYRLHRARDDGGYLAALVETCRSNCAALPAFDRVRAVAMAEAARALVQGINHAPAADRAEPLRAWAAGQHTGAGDARWFELVAAASSSLVVLALLATSADQRATEARAEQVAAAYFPWIDALTTLLDSLVDREADASTGDISFVGCYPDAAGLAARLGEIATRGFGGARRLPDGDLHVVLVAGMVALQLSHAAAWSPEARPATLAVLRASGSVVRPLLQILRAWRMLRGEPVRWRAPKPVGVEAALA